MREIYNEGRVVGLSAYELYVRQLLSTNPDATPMTEREWLTSTLSSNSSMILRIPEGTPKGYKDYMLPDNSTLAGATVVYGSVFQGKCTFVEDEQTGEVSNWASNVLSYGPLIANTADSHPVTPGLPEDVPVDRSIYSESWNEDFKDMCKNYLKIQSGLVVQPGEWNDSTQPEEPTKYLNPDFRHQPFVRLLISEDIDHEILLFLHGFADSTLLKGEFSYLFQGSTHKPENGDFLGPEMFPWSCPIVLALTTDIQREASEDYQDEFDRIYQLIDQTHQVLDDQINKETDERVCVDNIDSSILRNLLDKVDLIAKNVYKDQDEYIQDEDGQVIMTEESEPVSGLVSKDIYTMWSSYHVDVSTEYLVGASIFNSLSDAVEYSSLSGYYVTIKPKTNYSETVNNTLVLPASSGDAQVGGGQFRSNNDNNLILKFSVEPEIQDKDGNCSHYDVLRIASNEHNNSITMLNTVLEFKTTYDSNIDSEFALICTDDNTVFDNLSICLDQYNVPVSDTNYLVKHIGGEVYLNNEFNLINNNAYNAWKEVEWNIDIYDGYTIWTDGENTYYSWPYHNAQYVLNKSTRQWEPKTWNIDYLYGYNVWKDGDNVYYSTGTADQYVLDKTTSTWKPKTWNGYSSITGQYIWKDNNNNIYYSRYDEQYVLDRTTDTWISKTWVGLSSFRGEDIWTDGENTYYSGWNSQYVLDKSSSVWSPKTWNGLSSLRGEDIWTDGIDIYWSYSSSRQYVLDKSTSTWKVKKWAGFNGPNPLYMWTDGEKIYYSQIYGDASDPHSSQYELTKISPFSKYAVLMEYTTKHRPLGLIFDENFDFTTPRSVFIRISEGIIYDSDILESVANDVYIVCPTDKLDQITVDLGPVLIDYEGEWIDRGDGTSKYKLKTVDPIPLVSWDTGTDFQIGRMIQAYYDGYFTLDDIMSVWHIGDTRNLSLSTVEDEVTGIELNSQTEYSMTIIGFDLELLEDPINDKTKSLMTVTVDLKTEGRPEGYVYPGIHYHSWKGSDIRTFCNELLLNALPQYIEELVKPVSKISSIIDGGAIRTVDSAFLFSEYEVSGYNFMSENLNETICYHDALTTLLSPMVEVWSRSGCIDENRYDRRTFCNFYSYRLSIQVAKSHDPYEYLHIWIGMCL